MSDFLMIDENAIPQGGDNSKFGPLEEGAYNATCVAMVSGLGTKYQSEEKEQKVRFVFAIDNDGETKFIKTNWMKISLWDGEPNPSALWTILSAWTNQKTAENLIAKMGRFDLYFFLGKPITLGLKISKDEKWNIISDYYAPKKGAATIESPEIPHFCITGDKRVATGITYVIMEGATIKAPKSKDGDAVGTSKIQDEAVAESKVDARKMPAKDDGVTAAPTEDDDSSQDLPF